MQRADQHNYELHQSFPNTWVTRLVDIAVMEHKRCAVQTAAIALTDDLHADCASSTHEIDLAGQMAESCEQVASASVAVMDDRDCS